MKYQFALIFLMINYLANAQKSEYINIRVNDNTVFDDKIAEKDKAKIISSISTIVNDYSNKANLLDYNAEKKSVSEQSIADFRELFNSDRSEVYDDVSLKPSMIKLSEYIDLIYQNMNDKGVLFEITDAYLSKVTYDESGYYNAIVKINKVMLNGLNQKKAAILLKKQDLKPIEMSIDVQKNFNAKIYKIEGKVEAIKKSSTKELLVAARYGLAMPTLKLTAEQFDDNTTADDFSFKSKYIASLGGEFRFALKEKNRLRPRVGLAISMSEYELSTSGFTSRNDYARNAQLEETVTIDSISKFNFEFLRLEIPVGAYYRLYQNYHSSSTLDIEAALINQFGLTYGARFIGTQTYIVDQKGKSDDLRYVCKKESIASGLGNTFEHESASYNLGIRVGLSFQKDLVYDKIRWYISADYTYFTSPLINIEKSGKVKSEPNSDAFKITNDHIPSVGESYNVYLPVVTAHQIGVSVGVIFKIKN